MLVFIRTDNVLYLTAVKTKFVFTFLTLALIAGLALVANQKVSTVQTWLKNKGSQVVCFNIVRVVENNENLHKYVFELCYVWLLICVIVN